MKNCPKEITDRIDDISSRDYKLLLRSLFYCGDDLLAFHLNRALEKGINKNKNAIEIMVTQTESAEKHKNFMGSYERSKWYGLDTFIRFFIISNWLLLFIYFILIILSKNVRV